MEDTWTWPKKSRPYTCRCRSSRTPSSTQISSHRPTSLLTSKTSTRSKVHTQPAVCCPSDQLEIQASRSSALLWFYHIQSVVLEQHLQQPEPIFPIRRIRKLRRGPETPGGPLALKEDFILVSFWVGPAAMKTWMIIYCNVVLSPFLCEKQSNNVTWKS